MLRINVTDINEPAKVILRPIDDGDLQGWVVQVFNEHQQGTGRYVVVLPSKRAAHRNLPDAIVGLRMEKRTVPGCAAGSCKVLIYYIRSPRECGRASAASRILRGSCLREVISWMGPRHLRSRRELIFAVYGHSLYR
jgi:hypothetical protein